MLHSRTCDVIFGAPEQEQVLNLIGLLISGADIPSLFAQFDFDQFMQQMTEMVAVELRAFLRAGATTLTSTWSYILPPE